MATATEVVFLTIVSIWQQSSDHLSSHSLTPLHQYPFSFNYTTMDPEGPNTRTGRAYIQKHHPDLFILPMYVTDPFRRYLLQQYEQEAHLNCTRLRRKPPLYFVPSESWWYEQAWTILTNIMKDGHLLLDDKCNCQALQVLLDEHISVSLGGAMPLLPA